MPSSEGSGASAKEGGTGGTEAATGPSWKEGPRHHRPGTDAAGSLEGSWESRCRWAAPGQPGISRQNQSERAAAAEDTEWDGAPTTEQAHSARRSSDTGRQSAQRSQRARDRGTGAELKRLGTCRPSKHSPAPHPSAARPGRTSTASEGQGGRGTKPRATRLEGPVPGGHCGP